MKASSLFAAIASLSKGPWKLDDLSWPTEGPIYIPKRKKFKKSRRGGKRK